MKNIHRPNSPSAALRNVITLGSFVDRTKATLSPPPARESEVVQMALLH